jgi:uncharacterized membrane protein YccC
MAAAPQSRAGCVGSPGCKKRGTAAMTMMLLAIFAAAGLGMFATRFGRRENTLVALIAAALVAIYFLRPYYMT